MKSLLLTAFAALFVTPLFAAEPLEIGLAGSGAVIEGLAVSSPAKAARTVLLIDAVIVGVAFNVLDHHTRLQLVALAAYGAIMWKLKGTTIGGIVCNLKIVRLDGRELDWSTAIVRALGCFLSLVVLGLGFMWIAFDPGRQAWHDKIAGTAVVRVPQGVSLL